MNTKRRGSWTVTAINGVVAVTVLTLVAVLALVVKPPAPPGIAAFAPQVSKPIAKAPPGQSARFGNGPGACSQGQVCVGPSATPKPSSAAPSVVTPSFKPLRGALPPGLQCYEWPDGSVTQIFDPQSPPCISRWDDSKGNGGATSQGVTGNEIRVAFPVVSTSDLSTWPVLKPIVDFFNSRFQLYGRKITIVPFVSQQADGYNQAGGWNDPVRQRADAAAIAQQRVFATTDFLDPIPTSWSLPTFLEAMVKHKIVSVSGGDITPFDTADALAKRSPYVWSYYPTLDELMRNVATMTCRQLVGKPAIHSPDENLKKKIRKFAIFLPTDERLGGPMPGLKAMLDILDSCGVHSPRVVRHAGPNDNQAATTVAATFAELSREGVTSVITLPYGGNGRVGSPMVGAQQAGYTPEWILIGHFNYYAAYTLNDPQTQTAGAFGVGNWNKQPQLPLEPWHQAAIAGGGDSRGVGLAVTGRAFYQEMLLLASGIQMAGPHLTPESFAQGLHSTTFPNPGAGTAPLYQGTVGFSPGDQIMVDDYLQFWLDTRTSGSEVSSSPANNQHKAFCLVARGRRYNVASWPTEDSFYRPPCR